MREIEKQGRDHQVAGVMYFLMLIALMGCSSWYFSSALQLNDRPGAAVSSMVILMGILLIFMNIDEICLGAGKITNPQLSHAMWDPTVSMIRRDVLKRLYLLTGEEREQNQGLIINLRNDVDQLLTDKQKTSAIGLFKHEHGTLTQMRRSVISTNKPFAPSY